MSSNSDDLESTPNQNGTASASLTEQARAFGAAFKETFGFGPGGITTNTIRTNAQSGDAVRWESSAGGDREPSSYRYGVVVDGLTAEDEPDDSLLVAVYRANSDRSGWENTGDQEVIQNDNLEVVGNDGKASLPAVSDVVTNTVNSEDSESESEESEDGNEGEEAAEADDDGEADAEPEDENETNTDESDSPDEGGQDGEEENEESESNSESTDSTTMTEETQKRIKELAEDDDVPFDETVLSEFTEAQLDAIDAPREDDGAGEGDDRNTEDEPPEGEMPEGEPSNPEEARDEDDEEDGGDNGDDANADSQAQNQVPSEIREEISELREELNEVKQENQDLRQKTDPDVIKATQARQQLAEATEIDASELDALPDDTAINMAANIDDGVGLSQGSPQQARANTIGAGAQSGPNMAGAPGSVTRTNTENEDEDSEPTLAGRAAYEKRNGSADSD